MLWRLLDPLLVLLAFFGGVCGAALSLYLVVIGASRSARSYVEYKRRRDTARRALRAWADVAFPPVEWDGRRYVTHAELQVEAAERQRQAQATAAQPQMRPVTPVVLPVAARRHRRHQYGGHGFERRYA
jgi:hypothetical protein